MWKGIFLKKFKQQQNLHSYLQLYVDMWSLFPAVIQFGLKRKKKGKPGANGSNL
jgi:hypothetical protein